MPYMTQQVCTTYTTNTPTTRLVKELRPLHMAPPPGPAGRLAEEILVVERRRAALDHFQAGDLRAPVNEIRVDLLFDLPDAVQPGMERLVFHDAAQQGHGGVRVHVDETRDGGLSAAVHHLGFRGDPAGEAGVGGLPEHGFQSGVGQDFRDDRAVDEDIDGFPFQLDVLEEDHVVFSFKKTGGRPVCQGCDQSSSKETSVKEPSSRGGRSFRQFSRM